MKLINGLHSLFNLHFWAAFRFGVVGVITAAIYFFVMWLVTSEVGAGYILAVTAAYCVSTLFHYLVNRNFTFNAQSGKHKQQLAKYILLWIINYLITLVVVSIFVERIGLSVYWGVCASVVVTFFVGYILSSYWVFKVEDFDK